MNQLAKAVGGNMQKSDVADGLLAKMSQEIGQQGAAEIIQEAARRANINPNGAPEHRGRMNGGDVQALREEVRQLREALGYNSEQEGRYNKGDRDQYVASGRENSPAGRGGVIRFSQATVPSAASPGDTISVTPDTDVLDSRLQGQKVVSFFALPSNDLNDDLQNIEINALLNDSDIPSIKNVPLFLVSDTADGEVQRYTPGDVYVPLTEIFTFEVEVINSLNTGSDGTVDLFIESDAKG